jgi:hypothetical protein
MGSAGVTGERAGGRRRGSGAAFPRADLMKANDGLLPAVVTVKAWG